ncbi:MAG: pentapeptide repeat-containing protein, partial [Minicystis sp.]
MIRTREDFEARLASGLGFEGEIIEDADLDAVVAEGQRFAGSTWRRVRAHGASFADSIWQGARLENVDFQGADLSRSAAPGLDASTAEGEAPSDLRGLRIDGA